MKSYYNVLRMPPWAKAAAFTSALALMLAGCGTKAAAPEQGAASVKSAKNAEDKETAQASEKPNVVYIVLDDSGFSDLGSYGSEIKTPNLDKLAENGLRYNNAHVAPVCSPTRASLLTGRNSHSFGMATVANFDMGPDNPNKRGRIDPSAGTIAEVLKENDYNTYALGKWHLAPSHHATAAGPYDHWPLQKGFDRFYGFLEDSSDQYKPELVQDNSFIETPDEPDYHFSEDIVRQANQYVTDQASFDPDTPFFLYLAFGAQHQPVQVPQEYIDLYDGVYDKGWDEIRKERFEKQKEMGIISEDAKLAPLNPGVPEWDSLSAEEKEAFVQFQQAYAGFMTHTDEQIGKLMDTLERTGELDNTMFVFLSDNGASPMGKATGSINHTLAYNDIAEPFSTIYKNKDLIGTDQTKSEFPQGWAQVSNTPFKLYKSTMYEAGIRTPLIISYPKGIQAKGEVRDQYVHVSDITPTVYELMGIDLPKEIDGVKQMKLHGKSLIPTFSDPETEVRETQYFENNGQRAIYHDGWKAIARHVPKTPYEEDVWELYHISEDPTEQVNLAEENPKQLKKLQKLFEKEAKEYGVYPMTDIAGDGFLFTPEDSLRAKSEFVFYDGMSRLPEGATPFILNKSYSITVPIDRPDGDEEGVLAALGSTESGYTLYVKEDKAVYEYNRGDSVYRIESSQPLPEGEAEVKLDFELTGENSGTATLLIDGKPSGAVDIELTHRFKVSFEGLDVGHDSNYPVSKDYADKDGFPFAGEIEKVVYQIQK